MKKSTFYKIGFYVLLVFSAMCVALFMQTNPMKRVGAMSWIDIYSENPTATVKFLDDVFGIKVVSTTNDAGFEYQVIKTAGQMWPFAGVMSVPAVPGVQNMSAGSMIYLTVDDYVATADKIKSLGGVAKVENKIAGGMLFGVYTIPGNITIGIAQYENVPSK